MIELLVIMCAITIGIGTFIAIVSTLVMDAGEE